MVQGQKYMHGSLGMHSYCDNSYNPQNAHQRAFSAENGISDQVDKVTYYQATCASHLNACSVVSWAKQLQHQDAGDVRIQQPGFSLPDADLATAIAKTTKATKTGECPL